MHMKAHFVSLKTNTLLLSHLRFNPNLGTHTEEETYVLSLSLSPSNILIKQQPSRPLLSQCNCFLHIQHITDFVFVLSPSLSFSISSTFPLWSFPSLYISLITFSISCIPIASIQHYYSYSPSSLLPSLLFSFHYIVCLLLLNFQPNPSFFFFFILPHLHLLDWFFLLQVVY